MKYCLVARFTEIHLMLPNSEDLTASWDEWNTNVLLYDRKDDKITGILWILDQNEIAIAL